VAAALGRLKADVVKTVSDTLARAWAEVTTGVAHLYGMSSPGSGNVIANVTPGIQSTAGHTVDFGVQLLLFVAGGEVLEALEAAGGAEALAARAGQVHDVLDPIAQAQRTTAILRTDAGDIIAGGARDLTPAQRALLGPGEVAAKLPGAHAEVTALRHATGAGWSPEAMAVTRAICPQCAAAIVASGGTLTSPTTAIWVKQ
jgi:tRNA(Arg) A34 adenosine deaminase TadA